MGLLDILFGRHKQPYAPKSKAPNRNYTQGYHDGYRNAYEEGSCEDWDCNCMNEDTSCTCEEEENQYFEEEEHDSEQDVYADDYDSEGDE